MLLVRFYDFVPEIYVLKCFNVNVQIMDRKRNEICCNGKIFFPQVSSANKDLHT